MSSGPNTEQTRAMPPIGALERPIVRYSRIFGWHWWCYSLRHRGGGVGAPDCATAMAASDAARRHLAEHPDHRPLGGSVAHDADVVRERAWGRAGMAAPPMPYEQPARRRVCMIPGCGCSGYAHP